MCSASSDERCVLPKGGPTPLLYTQRGTMYMHRDRGSRRLLPESRGCSDRALWEIHCGVWRQSWQSSWASSLTPSHRTNDPGPASRSGTGPVSPRVPEVEMPSTCGRGPGPTQEGPGPPRAIRTPADGSGASTCLSGPRELSAQLAALEGSGAATCHADAGAGANLPLEARPPTAFNAGG